MILDAKNYIKQLNESYSQIISDISSIENIFKQASENDSITPGDDREDMVYRTENNMKNAAKNLLKCDIPPYLNENILKYIDTIFEKYVINYFNNYATSVISDSYVSNYDDYDDFKTSIYDDHFWHIVEFFFEELAIYTYNAVIYVSVDDEKINLCSYYDPIDDYESKYDIEWSDAEKEKRGDISYENALQNTIIKLEEVFEEVVKDNFNREDWISETEHVFGGERGYWNYKGF